MKSTLLLLILASTVAAARADYVIKQKVDNDMPAGQSGAAMQPGSVTMKIKGDKIRMDISVGQGGQFSTIIDSLTGDSVTLISQQKRFIKMTGEQMKQSLEQRQKMSANANAEPPKLVDTGKSEVVGGYKSEIYSWTNAEMHAGGLIWASKDFPNYAAVKAEMDKVTKSPFGKMTKNMMPDTTKLSGLEVKTKTEAQGMTTTTMLVSAQSETVDAAQFEVPKDYQEIKPPGSAPAFKPSSPPPAQ